MNLMMESTMADLKRKSSSHPLCGVDPGAENSELNRRAKFGVLKRGNDV